MALEKPGKLGIFSSYFVATLLHNKSWSAIAFGGDPDSFVDPGSFSRILCHDQCALTHSSCYVL